MDNNLVSVKLGDKVYSWDQESGKYKDVTATYPYIGGTLQTEFNYEESPIGEPIERGGYLVYKDMIYALSKFDLNPSTPIYATLCYPTTYYYDPKLPIVLDAYNEASTLYTDDTWEHVLEEMPHNGDSFYIIYSGNLELVQNAVIYPTATAASTAADTPPAPPTPVHNNNKVSVKLGDKVLSINEDGEHWDDVTATYPYIGGTLQTEFAYEDGDTPTPPDETGGYFISDDNKIWSLERWNGMDGIRASPLQTSWDEDKSVLPAYFNTYETPVIYSDEGLQHPVTEFPHEGDTFYYLDGGVHTVANVHLYSTMIAGSTATNTPPSPQPYNKPLIYNSDLDCIEKSLGNIEVTGDMKAGSVTTPKINADEITTPSLIVTQPVENLTVGNLTVTDTASINHATIVTEEDIHSEADFIELRVGNPIPTPSTGSGFKVKNYDGNNNNLELVTDSNGTFRIGAENSLQPIATREEATALNNNDLLAWDATNNQLKHITRPTVNGTALKAIVANGAVTGYDWGSSGGSGVSFIGTRAAYDTAKLIPEGQDGYIPAGSLVIITDEDELIIGDEVQ